MNFIQSQQDPATPTDAHRPKREEDLRLREKMHSHIQKHCLLSGSDFTLSAGSSSAFYFDCKKATLNGNFLSWMADYILRSVVPDLPQRIDTVGGMTLGADFMTAALVMRAAQLGMDIEEGSIVRKEPKKHGTRSRIENELKDRKVLVVDDVITSGAAISKACKEFQNAGYEVVAMLTLVDREAGGVAALEQEFKLPVISVFRSADFLVA